MAAGGEVPVPLSSLAGLLRRVALAVVATSTLPLPASSRVVVAGAPPPLCGVVQALVVVTVVLAPVIPPAGVFYSEVADERPADSGY